MLQPCGGRYLPGLYPRLALDSRLGQLNSSEIVLRMEVIRQNMMSWIDHSALNLSFHFFLHNFRAF